MYKMSMFAIFSLLFTFNVVSIANDKVVANARQSDQITATKAADYIPAGKPIKRGWISSKFGAVRNAKTGKTESHTGIDFSASTGEPIYAVASGLVVVSRLDKKRGYVITIDHGNGYKTLYAHNARNLVISGEKVKQGQLIATVGNSGRSTGPHVHFEILKNNKPIDPKPYIKRANLKK